MAHVRDSDTSLWLHNKLGTSNDLWTGGSICSQLNQDVLKNIRDCFIDLQSQVKLKLLLAFLHIPRRNVEEWRIELEEVIEVASADNDQWVSMLAELLKAFPSTGNLNFQIEENAKVFTDLTNDVRKIVKKYCDQAILPLECLYLNRNSFNTVVGHLPQPAKHFALKRKPKSAALRAELLQKSNDAALSLKKNASTPTVPIRCRGISKSISDAGSFRGLGAKNLLGSSTFRSQPNRLGQNSINRSVSGAIGRPNPAKKDGGIKLLDITEQPQGYGRDAKRRKKLPENEVPDAKKEGVTVGPLATTPTQTATPDYAAGLLSSTQLTNPSGSVTSSTVGVDYLPTSNITGLPGQTTTTGQTQIVSFQSPSSASLESTSSNSPTTNPSSTSSVIISNPNATTILSPSNANHTAKTIGNLASMGGASVQVTGTPPPPQMISQSQPNSQITPVAVAKKGLHLSRDQMMEAQEMFKNSNKVTRPEKALILGFMAGSRDNPCPPLGDIVTIKLSENKEEIFQNGVAQMATIETHFQMNYKTGEWKRVKKIIKADV